MTKLFVLFDGSTYVGTATDKEELAELTSKIPEKGNPRVVIGLEKSVRIETKLTFGGKPGRKAKAADDENSVRTKKNGTPAKKPGRKPKAVAAENGVRLKKDGTPAKKPGRKPKVRVDLNEIAPEDEATE